MNKLALLLIRTFIGPLVVTFVIALFILDMQFLWVYADDLMGKGLETSVILELMIYASARFVNMALPLAILMSSIMTMGALAEHYELTAMKSAGLSLIRILRPLMILIVLIGVGAFYFSNNGWPIANLKFRTLLFSVTQQKPALNLSDGTFYNGIEGFSIRVGQKDNDTGALTDVLIYDHRDPSEGSRMVIRAKRGKMQQTEDKRFLLLNLYEGHSYEEQKEDTRRPEDRSNPHVASTFEHQVMRIDLSSLSFNKADEDLFKSAYEMMTIRQLEEATDSIRLRIERKRDDLVIYGERVLMMRRDTIAPSMPELPVKGDVNRMILRDLSYAQQLRALQQAQESVRNYQRSIENLKEDIEGKERMADKYAIEWHRKYFLAFSCIVLFFIGAPLGAIIRKGGLGLPTVVAIILFLLYYIVTIIGERMVKSGSLEPMVGMWISSVVLFPMSVFLTYKAATDSSIMNVEAYTGWFKNLSNVRMRILQLCHKPPVPAKDGGCIAMNNVTQGLLNAGHEVKLLTIFTHKHPLELDRLPENYIHDTDIEGIYVDTRVNLVDAFSSMITRDSYNINRFFSVDFDIRLKRVLQKERFDIVHLESLFMTPYIGTIRRYARRAKIILRSHNLEYIIWDRIATGTRNPAKRAYLKYLSKKLKSYELGMLNEVDGIAAISAGDAEKYASLGCPRPVITLPFGIDLDNYEVSLTQTDHTPLRLFHVGAMDWRPNLEGMLWFIERIWPNIRSATEDAELHLAGRGLDPEMFPEGIAGLHIHGEVECAKSFMDDHHIMIVPLLSAGGIRVKIIEGMAKGKAIITTQVGAEGIDYEDGRHLRIARSENEWSTIVEEWNRNRSRLEATGMAARALAEKHFDNRLIIDKLLAFYRDTLKL